MSNHLAIATTTAAFRLRIEQALARTEPGAVPAARVTAGPPRSAEATRSEPGVNLFLYQTFDNASLRSADLPALDAQGERKRRAVRALDLSYLLTFTGDDRELEPERLLGIVTRELSSSPVLDADLINEAVGASGDAYLKKSDLAEQTTPVRLTPVDLTLEELSRLWSVFFRTEYALSAAYLAGTVLLDGGR